MTADLAKLLELLGRDPREHITINTITDGAFTSTITTVADAPAIAGHHSRSDCWYSTAPISPRVTRGRGTARDVIGVRELFADLDVKPGGLPDYDTAAAVIDDLSGMLGSAPVAVVHSGHGLQPHWAIERGRGTDWRQAADPRWAQAVALYRRWGRLVAHVADTRGGHVDSVFDLSRVLRVPGTTNTKPPMAFVTVDWTIGAPVALTRLAEALDEYGIPETAGDTETLGAVVSVPTTWAWAQHTCGYVTTMIDGWASDTPSARHPWLTACAVRLAAAHRSGCITRADRDKAVTTLTVRFRWLLTHGGQPRDEARGEISDALSWGVARVTTLADGKVLDELGGHQHRTEPPDDPWPDGDPWEARPSTDSATDAGAAHAAPAPAAAGQVQEDRTAPAPMAPGDEQTTDPYADLWDSRPELAHVRDFARARRGSPWGVLGISLIRYAASIPPGVLLPPIIGSHASLNLFLALIAESSGGKSIANGISIDAFDYPDQPPVFNIGSGEGITDRYVHRENHAKKGEKAEWVTVQHTLSVIFDVAEVDDLAALKGRQSSTLLPQLRKAWSGEQLGFAYRDPEKALIVNRHAYRLGLMVGTQPRRAGALLDDDAGGTPQRFMWLPAADRYIPDQRPRQPDRMKLWLPEGWDVLDPAAIDHTMGVCAEAETEIDRAAVERNRYGASELDGHALLCQLKVAGVLAIMAGRIDVTADDWAIAGVLMRRSKAQREEVQAELQREAERANESRGRQEARRAVIVEETVEDAATRRVAKRVSAILPADGSWEKHSAARKRVAAKDRPHFDAAVARLIDAGQVLVRQVEYHGQTGYEYRRAEAI